MARAKQLVDERAPLRVTEDPEHWLARFIEVNGVDARAVFASARELHECLPVLTRPWDADGGVYPPIKRLHVYNPRRYTVDVLGYPVVLEFDSDDEATKGLAAYLSPDELAPDSTPPRRARKPRAEPAPPPAPPAASVPDGQADAFEGGPAAAPGEPAAGQAPA